MARSRPVLNRDLEDPLAKGGQHANPTAARPPSRQDHSGQSYEIVEEQQRLLWSGKPLLCRFGSASEGERESGAGGDHWRSAGANGFDDLARVDALEVNRGHAEVAVPELALDDVERHAFAGELDRVSVTELVGDEAAAHAGVCGAASECGARGGG
jgi:hypothetical protein